ncbi:MAG: hypothetical protein NT085_03365 [candidate division SR1 bacterium]|nr:hypothetical protein [candidate division SR1 bacterium]
MSTGKSYGKLMTFEQHVENHPNKDELKQYRRLQELTEMMHSEQKDEVWSLLEKEFQSVENAISLFETLKKKIFTGWEPM